MKVVPSLEAVPFPFSSPARSMRSRLGRSTSTMCSFVPPSFDARSASAAVVELVCRKAKPFRAERNFAIPSMAARASSETFATRGARGVALAGPDFVAQPAPTARANTSAVNTPATFPAIAPLVVRAMVLVPVCLEKKKRIRGVFPPPPTRDRHAARSGRCPTRPFRGGADGGQYTSPPRASRRARDHSPGGRPRVTVGPPAAAVRNHSASIPAARA